MLTNVTKLHTELIEAWRQGQEPLVVMDELDRLIAAQHHHNYTLWRLEDVARTPGLPDADLAKTKRAIDVENQLRNDAVEWIDEWLLVKAGRQAIYASLHSESPGLMIDRLSILSLKVFHTGLEVTRAEAPPGHAARAQARLEVLRTQRDDLSACLGDLWEAVMNGARRFKVYRQLKSYNDPDLNPAIYGREKR